MIFITGDCHGDIKRFSTKNFPEQKELTKDDYVIICGDFGLVWAHGGEDKEETHWLDWLEEKPFTTLFVDGNHENHNRLDGYPVEEWQGGRVHKIRPSVIHLMRGEIFDLEGKKFFAFGGASSHDIRDGILDMDKEGEWRKLWKRWIAEGKLFRVRNLEWWERELPSGEEMKRGRENLEAVGNAVEFIVTHCAPQSLVELVSKREDAPDCLTNYFDELAKTVQFQKWFFGHYHDDKQVRGKFRLLYESIVRLDL